MKLNVISKTYISICERYLIQMREIMKNINMIDDKNRKNIMKIVKWIKIYLELYSIFLAIGVFTITFFT